MLQAREGQRKPGGRAVLDILELEPAHQELWKGCALAWPLWDDPSKLAGDVGPYGLQGVFGSHLHPADWRAHELGGALYLGGVQGDSLSVADPPGDRLDNTSQISLEFTYKPAGVTGRQGLVGKYRLSTGMRSWQLFQEAAELRFQVSSDGASFESKDTSGVSFAADTTYQVVISWDAGSWKVYVDGEEVSTTGDFTSETSIFNGTQDLNIGHRVSSAGSPVDLWTGEIVSLRIWIDRALSAEDALLLWRDPWGMYRPSPGFPTPAVIHTGSTPAGDWQLVGEVAAGLETTIVSGLPNGVSHDFKVTSVDDSANESTGTITSNHTPVAAPAVAPSIRAPIRPIVHLPPWYGALS